MFARETLWSVDRIGILNAVLLRVDPMLTVRAAKPFHCPGWVYEEKVDGWRLLAFKDGSSVRLLSRHGSVGACQRRSR